LDEQPLDVIPTLIIIGLGILLGWAIFGKKQVARFVKYIVRMDSVKRLTDLQVAARVRGRYPARSQFRLF
jgi:predicted negative regulator of RcsB-dependent stress response